MAVVAQFSISKDYYFGYDLHKYMIHMIKHDIYDSGIELNKGVKIYLTKTSTEINNRGVCYDSIRLHAGRGNTFSIKASTRRVNWEETNKIGKYKPRY
tara:strand:- start:7158 stop:7451 length:294 start_codon:yes stop_codon:yes gene_type:complete